MGSLAYMELDHKKTFDWTGHDPPAHLTHYIYRIWTWVCLGKTIIRFHTGKTNVLSKAIKSTEILYDERKRYVTFPFLRYVFFLLSSLSPISCSSSSQPQPAYPCIHNTPPYGLRLYYTILFLLVRSQVFLFLVTAAAAITSTRRAQE